MIRFGRLFEVRNAGHNVIIPFINRMTKVNLFIVTWVLAPQEIIIRDKVTVRLDAFVYFVVIDLVLVVINIEDHRQAIIQLALTTLRNVPRQSELNELLAHRDQINLRLLETIDEQTEESWGIRATLVEIKDVLLPETMQRVVARQVELEHDKYAKIIYTQGESAAAKTLAEAAEIIQGQPAALQQCYLQTIVEISGERNSIIIPLALDIVNALTNLLKPIQK